MLETSPGSAEYPEQSEAETTPFGRLTAWARDLEQRHLQLCHDEASKLWKPTATAATELGYRCERRITYKRVLPWKAGPISPELASIFREGKIHEQDVLRRVEADLGVRIRNRSTSFRDERYDVAGQLDFEVYVPDVGWVPTEIKGLAWIPGDDVEGVDLENAPLALHRRYFAQLQTYLLLTNHEFGLFIFKSKATGRWRAIPVQLDYAYAETLLQRAEHVRDAVRRFLAQLKLAGWAGNPQDKPDWPLQATDEAGQAAAADRDRWANALAAAEAMLPDRIPDRSECRTCPFYDTCRPSEAAVDPALIITDEKLLADLVDHELRHQAKRGFDKVHAKLRNRFLETKGDRFLAGDFVVTKKPHGTAVHLEVRRANGAPSLVDAPTRAEAAEASVREFVRVVSRQVLPILGKPVSAENLETYLAAIEAAKAAVVNAPVGAEEESNG